MPRYWVISPFGIERPADLWERVWKGNLRDRYLSIGWGELGDVSRSTEEQIFSLIREKWPEQDVGAARRDCRMLFRFFNSVEPGDFVIARRGRKRIAAIGNVKRKAYYDPKMQSDACNQQGLAYPNHLDMQWLNSPRNKIFDDIVFGILTIYEISERDFRAFTRLKK